MQVGGAPTKKFRKEILQTMQVGAGPNIEADFLSAYNNMQVGVGPQQREFRKEILQMWVERNKFC